MTNSQNKNRQVAHTARHYGFPPGTALIVALLVMGVLMAISLALSTLVLRESVVTREFLDAGQSYYAAESASEIGLYGVKNSLPGWEPDLDGKPINIKIDNNYGVVAQLKILNKCRAYPCFDEGYDLDSAETKAFYAVLGLNESVTIPLFVIGENGEPTPITDFDVEFYAGFEAEDLYLKQAVSDWDVLRWKIVGLTNVGGKLVTESISDFTAVSKIVAGKFTNPDIPSWFGTSSCNGAENRYNPSIQCANYSVITNIENEKNCDQTKAREFYLYNTEGDHGISKVEHCYSLADFIKNHRLNYLTLTNLINPSVFVAGKSMDDAKTKLYYRVELFTDKDGGGKITTPAVREYADITADGYSGKSKQSVNVKIKRDSFMPVFNFSLYSTYRKERKDDKGNDITDSYWYGENAKK